MLPNRALALAFVSTLLASCTAVTPGTPAIGPTPARVSDGAPTAVELAGLSAAIDELAIAGMRAENVPGLAVIVVRSAGRS
jgi:hypothetical protein